MESVYWAAKAREEIGAEILRKYDDYSHYLETSGMKIELSKSFKTYYGPTQIESIDQSLKAIHVNHYASYIRNIHNMVTASRPAWEAQAVNTDLESQADTQLASGLLDYYFREKGIETKVTDAVMKALFLKEGWISLGWNPSGGEIIGENPESGDPIYSGDFKVESHTIMDVCRDINKKDMNLDWYIVRTYDNKYDLAAKYPELWDQIVALSPDDKATRFMNDPLTKENNFKKTNDDLIPVYELRHRKTPGMKNGRLTIALDKDVVLFDGPLPYKDCYLFPIIAGTQFETPFGHSYLMDLLPVQDALNATISAIVTNQAANAVNNFQVPKGAAPKVTTLKDGMNVWEYDPKAGKMETMDLLRTAPEVFNFANFLVQQGDLLSNVSQIGRGNAPTNMSGTAMALLQQQAVQSTSSIQASYTLMLENVGTALIQLLQTFAVAPQIAMIAGKSKRSMMKEFTRNDLKGIGRVFINRANPLTKTGAGRLEIANNLLQIPGMIKTPEQYLGVLTTGNLENLYQHDNSQRMLMVSENEKLMDGQEQIALMLDDHAMHVLEHSCVLNSPEARENPQIVQAVLGHIQQHLDIAKTMDPVTSAMLKQASFAQQAPMPQQAPQEPGEMPPEGGEQLPVIDGAPQVAMPSPAEPPNPNAFTEGV